jgi:arginyl-tRNA synthetase
MDELKSAIKTAVAKLIEQELVPELSRPEARFGDYTTNVAMQLGAKEGQTPREIAERLADELRKHPDVAEAAVAGPGFLNIFLTNASLAKATWSAVKLPKPCKGQEILIEFGDPNPFKEMHIGHIYSYIVGDALANLFAASGGGVRRLSYHGDVGLHVAKAIWGMQQDGLVPVKGAASSKQDISSYYVKGNKAYEEDERAKAEIQKINGHIYKRDDEAINKLHQWGTEASFAYFDKILKELAVKTDRRYLESDAASSGARIVKDNSGKVFKESQGAVVFEGEKAGLHTRVFITKQGLPTYEAKELGLAKLKKHDYPKANRSVIVTANEQNEYFKVVLAALKEIDDEVAKITGHVPHGFISLTSGKMSSRTGEVYSAKNLISDVESAAKKLYPKAGSEVWLAAIKFGLLKHRLGSDIVYDAEESVSLQGSSGPYLQYAHARARSILSKGGRQVKDVQPSNFNPAERGLARKISEYPEVVGRAAAELSPSHITSYLYELAQNFNGFYEKNRVIDDPRQDLRLKLVAAYADVISDGLGLLGITAPDQM